MNFCAGLQETLSSLHPKWTWRVAENNGPSTSVIILAQGQAIPGEVVVSLGDERDQKLAETIVGGQAYCDFLNRGKSEIDFARDLAAKILGQLKPA